MKSSVSGRFAPDHQDTFACGGDIEEEHLLSNEPYNGAEVYIASNSNYKYKNEDGAEVKDDEESLLFIPAKDKKYEELSDKVKALENKLENQDMEEPKSAPDSIHMLAVHFILNSTCPLWKDRKTEEAKTFIQAIIMVVLSLLVLASQTMIAFFLTEKAFWPSCTSHGDCPNGMYCYFDSYSYDYIFGKETTHIGNCDGECKEDYKSCDYTPCTLDFCSTIPNNLPKELCLAAVHCNDPKNKFDTQCGFVTENRAVLSAMGIVLLIIFAVIFVMNIYKDIETGTKQSSYLQLKSRPTLLKQIASSIIVAKTTFLPLTIVQVAVALMVTSPLQPANIVLNALSIAFVLEIDDVVGSFMIFAMNLKEDTVTTFSNCENSDLKRKGDMFANVFMTATCFGLFLYQIIDINNEDFYKKYKAILDGFDFEKETSCGSKGFTLIFNSIFGNLGFLCLKLLIEFGKSCRYEKGCKKSTSLWWNMSVLFSAGALFYALAVSPWLIQKSMTIQGKSVYRKRLHDDLEIAFSVFGPAFLFFLLLLWVIDKASKSSENTEAMDETSNLIENMDAMDETSKSIENMEKENGYMKLKYSILFIVLAAVLSPASFRRIKYRKCDGTFKFLGDGGCDKENNKKECGWDAGDCEFLNKEFKNCTVDYPYYIGDGLCDGGEYNTEDCGWDAGDCEYFNEKFPSCPRSNITSELGDGNCDGGLYNTEACGWDAGDCKWFNEKFPNCTVENPYWIGNGTACDGGAYNTEACGWDGGDCTDLNEKFPSCPRSNITSELGDGNCDGGLYNTEACGWDGGDCTDLNEKFPSCPRSNISWWLGDKTCDLYLNISECEWDGGDCIGEEIIMRQKDDDDAPNSSHSTDSDWEQV